MLKLLLRFAPYLILSLAGCRSIPPTPPRVDPCPVEAPVSTPLYKKTTWDALPGWAENSVQPGFLAWRNGCASLKDQLAWRALCAQAQTVPEHEQAIRQFIETHFTPVQVRLSNGSETGLVTGYYEPLLHGDTRQTAKARYPLYAPPNDLITVDLSRLYPDLKHRRLRGRLVGNKVVPYYSRAEMTEPPAKGQAIAWANDPIELFFLHIQGSGRIQLPNGEMIRVGYADHNGHPYRSVATWLVEQGDIQPSQASMQGIQAWARANPAKIDAVLAINPSFVFFKILQNGSGGPLGALSIPLTDGYSVAVDPTFTPLGAPLYLSTQYPNDTKPLQRLVVAQDTGSAIRGPIRIDFFWGFGKAAGNLAGKMKQPGSIWILWPKERAWPLSTALISE